jgi:HTH-type transcriptional regulator, sugar sensing transcriptional regulator
MSIHEELTTALSYFGLEKTDAMVYLGLLQMGSVTVGTMSAKLDIDRGKAYRSLNKLRNLGLITTTFSNPTICKAIEPKEGLTTIMQRREDEIITMQKLSRKIVEQLQQITRPEAATEISSFSIIQGRANIYARIGKLIQESTKTIYVVTTVEDILRMYHTAIPEKIKMCKQNKGDVRILTWTNSENLLPLVNRLNASETRIGKLPSKSRMIVEDGKHLIMSGGINESMDMNDDGDSVLDSNSIEMVENMYSLCEHLWKKSKSAEPMKKLAK